MKKTLIIVAIIITILSLNKEENIRIPKQSIRFRVIANSDSKNDQNIKKNVVSSLTGELQKIESSNLTLSSSRKIIKDKLPKFEEVIGLTLYDTPYKNNYKVNYGLNYFPKKEYKGVIYEEGEYESLVVTIGDGLGKNFWCVLFPPLCQIDEEMEDVEYTSLVKEIINKYF